MTYAPNGALFRGQRRPRLRTAWRSASRKGTGNLQRDTDALLQGLRASEPGSPPEGARRAKRSPVGGNHGAALERPAITGQREYISLSTTQLRDGNLLYVIGVAPRTEAGTYDAAFRQVRQKLEVTD